jgi:hypothetical protein
MLIYKAKAIRLFSDTSGIPEGVPSEMSRDTVLRTMEVPDEPMDGPALVPSSDGPVGNLLHLRDIIQASMSYRQ